MLSCRTPQQFTALPLVPLESKHLEAALADLITMSKAAHKRLVAQLQSSEQAKQTSKEKTDAEVVGQKKSKQKKDKATDIFEAAMSVYAEIPHSKSRCSRNPRGRNQSSSSR